MKTIEFSYETNDGRELNVIGETDGREIYFKLYDEITEVKVSRGSLEQIDVRNIEEFIADHAEELSEYESDFYDRYDDRNDCE